MVLIGVLARITSDQRSVVWADLEARPGVQPFEVDDPDRLGLLLEASSLAAAHDRLTDEINKVEGVLGTWPVYTDLSAETDAEQAVRGAHCKEENPSDHFAS
jgi:hypothetical protein